MSFDLLSEPIRKYIRDKRWNQLWPIQTAAISKILTTDNNYILASRTASGKTEAAFLPILSKVDFDETGVQVLYISPLIALINDQFYRIEELCKYLDVTVTKWHGEASKTLKERIIKQPNGIILITPESLEAMFINKTFNVKHLFSELKYVVIDEIHSFIGTDRGTQLKSILSRLQNVNLKPFSVVGLSATIGDYNEAKKFTGNEFNTKVLLDRTAKEINAVFRYFKNERDDLPLELLNDLYIETKDNKVLIFPNSRGRVEEVIQIDATHSIASLIQRVGRSGRKEGEKSNLFLYATKRWSLLQSLACWLLYQEGFIEPPQSTEKSYDILLHQALSITKGHSGIRLTDLVKQLKDNFTFNQIDVSEIEEILNHLIEIDFLEKLQQEVIIGVEGEKIVNSRDFYSVFKTEENYKVVNAGNTIGEISPSPQMIEDENILLAAKIWKIKFIDFKSKKIEVIPAKDEKKTMFFGSSGATIHPRIREKMFEILYNNNFFDVLDEPSFDEIEAMRKDFSVFNIQNLIVDRPLLVAEMHMELYTFTGTRINRTIQLLLNIAGIKNILEESCSKFDIDAPKEDLLAKWGSLTQPFAYIDSHITNLL